MAEVLTDAQGNPAGLRDDCPLRIEPSARVRDDVEVEAPSTPKADPEAEPYPQDVDELHLKMLKLVRNYVQAHGADKDFKVYLVWQCHLLGNRKCLFRTDLKDGRYYEVTYSSMRMEFYLDVYQKTDNQLIVEENRYA